MQSEERQHLLDTFDPSLYEGEKDSEEQQPDYMDKFLVLSEDTSDLVPVEGQSNDFVADIMPDLSDFDE